MIWAKTLGLVQKGGVSVICEVFLQRGYTAPDKITEFFGFIFSHVEGLTAT